MDQQQSEVTPHTAMSQALVLPEVLFRIGCYLDASHALICSQVSSTWYLNFAPIVWANLHIGRPKPNASPTRYTYERELGPRIRFIDLVSEDCNPSEQLDIIRSKACWLRSLTIHKHVSPQQFALGKECTQLQAISIIGPIPFNDDYTQKYWNSCKALLKQNRSTLKSLSLENTTPLDFSGKPTPGVPRWDPILSCAGHTNLTGLKLALCGIRGRHLKPFWKICERLEKLTLDKVSFDISRLPTQEQIQTNSKAARAAKKKAARRASKKSPLSPPPPKRFPNLRELTVNGSFNSSPERIMDLIIADCPRLESLDWTSQSISATRMDIFSNLIVTGTWPLLEKLKLSSSLLEDHLFKILQHTRKPLKVMNIEYMPSLGAETFSILKVRHFETLQEVNLSFLRSNQGYMVQDVLASCPSLEVVRAILLDAAAVMEDKRPWVCLGLKEFTMSLDITMGATGEDQESIREQRQEQSRALYTQLARLKQLRYLSLQPAQTRRHSINEEPFCLRLEMGLDLLAAQTQLEVINLYRSQQMSRNDVLWMVEHLKSLRMISGGLLNDIQVGKKAFKDKYLWDYELAKILNSHRIETPASVYDDGYLDDVQHLLGTGWPERDGLVYVEEEHETLEETDQVALEVQAVEWPAAAEWADWGETGHTDWSM